MKMDDKKKRNQVTFLKREGKRVLAIILATLMTITIIDFGGMQYVSAADESKVDIITEFTALSGEIANQQLAVGSSASEINLPYSLSVASEVYYVDEAQAVTGSAISVNSTYNLTGVTWELDAGQSSSASFDASVGNTYTYVPVLPETDTEGNPVRRAEGVSLPQIRVQIGSYGTQLYTITTNHTIEGNPVTLTIYSTQNNDVGDLAVVTGTGTLDHDYVYADMFLPYSNISGIKKVIIGEGITGIRTLFNSYLSNATAVEEVELPSTLTAIEEYAFQNCALLTSITIPEGVISIEKNAFEGCTSLEDLIVSNNSKLITIKNYAFRGCSKLADKDIFTYCQQLESVPGEYTFYDTNYSGEIILPRNLTSFAAFVTFKGKITTLYIPDTVLTNPSEPANVILKYKIENNQATITYINNIDKNTTSVTLPETICGAEVVAVDAQYRNNPVTINCTNHKIVDHTCQICGVTTKCGENTYYEYADGVLSILGSGAVEDYTSVDNSPWYSYRDSISKIIIGKDITRIGNSAFAGCTTLIDIELEEESVLSEIGSRAFSGCTSLADVDLFTKTPLTKIESYAFVNTLYTGVLMLPDTLTTSMASSLYFKGAGNVMVYIPEAAYVENPGTDCMWYKVENGEVIITKCSFVYMRNTTITVPETINGHELVAISDEARSAISEDRITLIDTAHSWDAQGHTCRICGYSTKCGDNMFYSIQDNVLTLSGSGTMYDYSSSDSTGTLPPWDSIKNNITKIVVGEDITSIGNNSFYSCDNLENLVFEESSKLTQIRYGAFLRCTKLSDVILPETLEMMEASFQSCSSATIYYPENALVSPNAFAGSEAFVTYKAIDGKKYITSPTTDMLKVPEGLSYTGADLKELALVQFGIIKDAITVQGVNFDVDIDETKWVKSIIEDSVINRGTYTAQYTGTFMFNGGNKPKVISKTFTVGKGVGVGSVMIANWEYGSAASTPVPTSITNGTDNVNFYYKDKDATDATYKNYNASQEGMYPVNSGDYTLKVVFESTDSADEVIAFADFTIYKATIDNSKFTIDPYTATYDSEGASHKAVSVTGNDGYLNDKAVTYSTSKDGTTNWSEYISTVPTMTDAGTLYVKVKISADNYDDWISGVQTASISAKSLNDSMINNISNQYYTGNAITPSVTVTDVSSLTLNKHYTVESYTNNTEVGTATVTIKGKDNYTGGVNKDFIILYYDGIVIPAYNGNTTKTAWYDGEVTITAEDFTISDSLNGPYTSSYIITGEGSNISKKFYYKKDGTGYITDGRVITVNIDKTAPVFSAGTDGITISDNNWKGFLNQITFGHFFKENKDVSILATDSGSDVDKYYYYIDTGSTIAKTAEELNSISFTEGSSFSITDEIKYIIYAYALDQAGNKSAYICTDGIVIDKTAPTVTLTAPAGSDLGDVSGAAKVQMNETGIITYVIKTTEQSGMTAQNILDAADKKTVSVIDGKTDTNLDVAFSGLTANNTYYMYAVGTDSAQNNGSVVSTSFTTTKTQPTFTADPTITGTYGQQVKDMTVSQVESTNGVDGNWSVSSTEKPSVGTTATYDVVFTPNDAVQYATVTVQVTPTVNPKSLIAAGATIGEVSGTHTYDGTEKKPVVTVSDSTATITTSDYEYSYSNNRNAGTATVTVTGKGNYIGTVNRTFTIDKAESAITIADGGTDYTRTYKDAAFSLSGITKTGDGIVGYTIFDSKNGAGIKVADDKVISIDSNGSVTIKGSGTAKITVFMGTTMNYKEAASKIITVTVNKKIASAVTDISKSYIYTAGSNDSSVTIDIAGLLPIDRGATTYVLAGNDAAYITNKGVDSNGNLTYKVNTDGTIGNTTTLLVTAASENYTDITALVKISLIDKLQVEGKADAKVVISGSNILNYGQKLSTLTLNISEAVFVVSGTSTIVPGILTWASPDSVPTVGTTKATWTFIPTDGRTYESLTGELAITVTKATPAVTTPIVTGFTYNPSMTLMEIVLNGTNGTWTVDGMSQTIEGTWIWKSGAVTPIVNNKGYVAVFTPNDTVNYSTVEKTVTVAVSKANPSIHTAPVATGITYGQTLDSAFLNGGSAQYSSDSKVIGYNNAVVGTFRWQTGTIKPAVSDSQLTEYTVIFTPEDTDNYDQQTTRVKLTVNKAKVTPNIPGSKMNPSYNTKKVSELTLPDGWNWISGDAVKDLAVGSAIMATAIYTGTGSGNYETESIQISITRSACTHDTTGIEIRNVKAATCTEEGYTGDTYCKECGQLISSGAVTQVLGHTGGTATCKDRAICSRCGGAYGELESSNHTHSEIRNVKTATCTAEGYTGDIYCADCGVKLSSGTTISALGHNYVSKVTKEPTCTETGIKTFTCSCGDSYTEKISALGHNYVSKVTKEPTTTEEGIMTYTCTHCGNSYTKAIAKLTVDTGKPYIQGDISKNGWEAIKNQVERTGRGDIVNINMNGTTTIPGNFMESIKGKDVTVVFNLGNEVQWKVNGKDVADGSFRDIDFGVMIDTQNIPTDIVSRLVGEKASIQISLVYEGQFGFTATLSINMDSKNAGSYANLFYYNTQTGKLEFMNAGEIGTDGSTELTFTHASDYTIVVSDTIMDGSKNIADDSSQSPTNTTAPKTGDIANIWIYVWVVVLSGVILIIGIGVIVVRARSRYRYKETKKTGEE